MRSLSTDGQTRHRMPTADGQPSTTHHVSGIWRLGAISFPGISTRSSEYKFKHVAAGTSPTSSSSKQLQKYRAISATMTLLQLEGKPLEIVLTTANAAAQAWYGYDQVGPSRRLTNTRLTRTGYHCRHPDQRGLRQVLPPSQASQYRRLVREHFLTGQLARMHTCCWLR